MSGPQGQAGDANATEEGASSKAGPAASDDPTPNTWDWKVQALAFAVFASGNIGLNYFNSWALKKTNPDGSRAFPGFAFPVFYTMWHMLLGCVASLLLLCTFTPPKEGGMPSFRQFWQYADALIPIAICTTLNVALNNVSLTIVSLFVNQVIKACGPLPTAIFSYILANKRYGWAVCISIVLIVAGSILSQVHFGGHHDIHTFVAHSNGSHAPTQNGHVAKAAHESSPLGIILCIISLLAASLKPVVQMLVMGDAKQGTFFAKPRPKLSPQQALFYDTGLAFVIMLIYWVASPTERAPSIAFLGDPEKHGIGFAIIAAGATMAFIFNLSTYWFIRVTSALTSTVGSNGIKIVIILASAASPHSGVGDPSSISGIAIVIVSIGAYAFFSYRDAQAAKAAAAKEPLLPSESTPLKK